MRLKLDDVLAQKYTVVEILATGQFVSTYRVKRNLQDYIAKSFSFHHTPDWKSMELFEREAKTLQNLDHPRIPPLIEFIKEEGQGSLDLHLIMQAISGQNLAQKLESGWRPSEAQLKDIASQSLAILAYLHALNPPVIHRDIKPSNLILSPDNQIYLIDFGGVQQVFQAQGGGGSTIIGTYGYMAPEQFQGRALPPSDLYGLGATLIHLASGQAPGELPHVGLRVDFHNAVHLSAHLSAWLEQMLEPDPAQRFKHAAVAREALHQVIPLTPKYLPSSIARSTVVPTLAQAENNLKALVEHNPIPNAITEVNSQGFCLVLPPEFKRQIYLKETVKSLQYISSSALAAMVVFFASINFLSLGLVLAFLFFTPAFYGMARYRKLRQKIQTQTEIQIGPEQWQVIDTPAGGTYRPILQGKTQDLRAVQTEQKPDESGKASQNMLTFHTEGGPEYLPYDLLAYHSLASTLCQKALETYKLPPEDAL